MIKLLNATATVNNILLIEIMMEDIHVYKISSMKRGLIFLLVCIFRNGFFILNQTLWIGIPLNDKVIIFSIYQSFGDPVEIYLDAGQQRQYMLTNRNSTFK
jgi:hypothetical protein